MKICLLIIFLCSITQICNGQTLNDTLTFKVSKKVKGPVLYRTISVINLYPDSTFVKVDTNTKVNDISKILESDTVKGTWTLNSNKIYLVNLNSKLEGKLFKNKLVLIYRYGDTNKPIKIKYIRTNKKNWR